ncbi:hypothetical protein [Salana multivorans]
MPDKDYTHIAMLLDRSGSMATIRQATIEGFDAFVAEQRATPGRATLTLAQFDYEYQEVYADKPIAEVPSLVLEPRGNTALLDSIGRLISSTAARLGQLSEEELPGTVVLGIMTDGHENASREAQPRRRQGAHHRAGEALRLDVPLPGRQPGRDRGRGVARRARLAVDDVRRRCRPRGLRGGRGERVPGSPGGRGRGCGRRPPGGGRVHRGGAPGRAALTAGHHCPMCSRRVPAFNAGTRRECVPECRTETFHKRRKSWPRGLLRDTIEDTRRSSARGRVDLARRRARQGGGVS